MTQKQTMAINTTGKDDWETPPDFFAKLDAEFHFNLDPCSSDDNALCENHYTIEDDGLSKDWGGQIVFVNPPYSKRGSTGANGQAVWIRKCYEESMKPDTTVVALLPVRTDTAAFHNYIYGKAEIRFVRGRLAFYENHQRSKTYATFPSMVCIWGRRNGVNPIQSMDDLQKGENKNGET